MSSTTSQTNVIEPTAREQEILQVIHHAGKPLTIQALSKTPDLRGRIKPKELSRLVTDLVERGKLFRFEGLSKSPQYSDQDPYTYALRFLEQMLDTRKTLSNLRASKKLAKLLQEADVENVEIPLNELIDAGEVRKHPCLPGRRTDYFSTRPPNPQDYLKAAAGRFINWMEKTYSRLEPCGVSRAAVIGAAQDLLGLAKSAELSGVAEDLPPKGASTSDTPAFQPGETKPPDRSDTERGVDLPTAIMNAFLELARERHCGMDMVPIHEVCAEVKSRCGEHSARHDRFDPVVQSLRRNGRIRLISITDPRDATQEQLNDSIPGIHETLFYMRPP